MAILKLKPACKDYIWGGRRLIDEYNKPFEGERLAETWEMSCHPDAPASLSTASMPARAWHSSLLSRARAAWVATAKSSRISPS